MNELFTTPLLFTLIALSSFVFGIVVGVLSARGGRQAAIDESFSKGATEGRLKAEQEAKESKEELAVSLSEQFSEMRNGILKTVQAYQHAVESCSEKLSLPEAELLALGTQEKPLEKEASNVVEAEAIHEECVSVDIAKQEGEGAVEEAPVENFLESVECASEANGCASEDCSLQEGEQEASEEKQADEIQSEELAVAEEESSSGQEEEYKAENEQSECLDGKDEQHSGVLASEEGDATPDPAKRVIH